MTLLFNGLTSLQENLPVARIDDMVFPELAQAWDLYDVPAWVFLDSKGNAVSKFEGEMDETAVISEVKHWIGFSDK
jgi:hypothetical protein